MPDFVGMSPIQAKRTLEEMGFQNTTWSARTSSSIPSGYIAGESPWAGRRLSSLSELDLVISAGPRYHRFLRFDSCDYTPRLRCGNDYHAFSRMSVMHRGELIPGEPARVPDVEGMTREQAISVLAEHTFTYSVVRVGAGSDVVEAQRPSEGEIAPAHSLVVLQVDCQLTSSPMPANVTVYDRCGGKYIPHYTY
jgi:beta-lactam-binding protein with PASTA domain